MSPHTARSSPLRGVISPPRRLKPSLSNADEIDMKPTRQTTRRYVDGHKTMKSHRQDSTERPPSFDKRDFKSARDISFRALPEMTKKKTSEEDLELL